MVVAVFAHNGNLEIDVWMLLSLRQNLIDFPFSEDGCNICCCARRSVVVVACHDRDQRGDGCAERDRQGVGEQRLRTLGEAEAGDGGVGVVARGGADVAQPVADAADEGHGGRRGVAARARAAAGRCAADARRAEELVARRAAEHGVGAARGGLARVARGRAGAAAGVGAEAARVAVAARRGGAGEELDVVGGARRERAVGLRRRGAGPGLRAEARRGGDAAEGLGERRVRRDEGGEVARAHARVGDLLEQLARLPTARTNNFGEFGKKSAKFS